MTTSGFALMTTRTIQSGALTNTGNICLMGYLELLHPRNAGLDESHVQHVLSLIPHLQKLEGRNLQGKLFPDDRSLFLLIVLILYR